MAAAFTTVSAIVPSILIGWYFHKRDIFPEPGKVIWITFFLGVIIVLPVIIVELAIDAVLKAIGFGPLLGGFLDAFLVAAVPEESFKLLALMVFAYRHREFNEPMDGIVYGVIVSLGFATLENVMYVSSGGMGVAIMRALSSVPGHAAWGAVMGAFVGRAKFAATGKAGLILIGFVAAVILHGLYDFPLMSIDAYAKASGATLAVGSLALITLAALIGSVVWSLLAARQARRAQQASIPYAWPAHLLPPQQKDRTMGSVLAALGFLSASIGGMITLGLGLVAISGEITQSVGAFIIAILLCGLAPTLLGFILFASGLAKLNAAATIPLQPPPAYGWPGQA